MNFSAWSKRQKGPVYVEKICPGKEGHPPSQLSFSEPYMGKMLTPPPPPPRPLIPESTVLAHALIVSPNLQCFYREELDRLEVDPTVETGWPVLLGEPTFVFCVNDSPRKCRKSWLARGNLGLASDPSTWDNFSPCIKGTKSSQSVLRGSYLTPFS